MVIGESESLLSLFFVGEYSNKFQSMPDQDKCEIKLGIMPSPNLCVFLRLFHIVIRRKDNWGAIREKMYH